jgi:hypothetical protein
MAFHRRVGDGNTSDVLVPKPVETLLDEGDNLYTYIHVYMYIHPYTFVYVYIFVCA